MKKNRILAAVVLAAAMLATCSCGIEDVKNYGNIPKIIEFFKKAPDMTTSLTEENLSRICIGKDVYTFPMKVGDLMSNGWTVSKEYTDYAENTLKRGYSTFNFELYNEQSGSFITVAAVNPTDEDAIPLKEAFVETLIINFEEESNNVKLYGGIEGGTKVYESFDEIESCFGDVFTRAQDYAMNNGRIYSAMYQNEDGYYFQPLIYTTDDNFSPRITQICYFWVYGLNEITNFDNADYLDSILTALLHYDETMYKGYYGDPLDTYLMTYDYYEYAGRLIKDYFGMGDEMLTLKQVRCIDRLVDYLCWDTEWEIEDYGDTLEVTYDYTNGYDLMEKAFDSVERYGSYSSPADEGFIDEFFETLEQYAYESKKAGTSTDVVYLDDDGSFFQSDLDYLFLYMLGFASLK